MLPVAVDVANFCRTSATCICNTFDCGRISSMVTVPWLLLPHSLIFVRRMVALVFSSVISRTPNPSLSKTFSFFFSPFKLQFRSFEFETSTGSVSISKLLVTLQVEGVYSSLCNIIRLTKFNVSKFRKKCVVAAGSKWI
ncbi:hypothetical protein LWI28_005374 [Acer negundo]|uniref:Uncharacterized protein n=1 Tax=Acer negundo TaxID=4023 RepID=A0AAD5P264_ACENE|nr:hypothetical protein LWI28_005374 [Acer negundo]